MGMALCEASNCIHWNDCARGAATNRVGVHTTSHFEEICNAETDFNMYYPGEPHPEKYDDEVPFQERREL